MLQRLEPPRLPKGHNSSRPSIICRADSLEGLPLVPGIRSGAMLAGEAFGVAVLLPVKFGSAAAAVTRSVSSCSVSSFPRLKVCRLPLAICSAFTMNGSGTPSSSSTSCDTPSTWMDRGPAAAALI